jgi:hypothetical protein
MSTVTQRCAEKTERMYAARPVTTGMKAEVELCWLRGGEIDDMPGLGPRGATGEIRSRLSFAWRRRGGSAAHVRGP